MKQMDKKPVNLKKDGNKKTESLDKITREKSLNLRKNRGKQLRKKTNPKYLLKETNCKFVR